MTKGIIPALLACVLAVPAGARQAGGKALSPILSKWLAAEGGYRAVLNLDTLEDDLAIDSGSAGSWTVHCVQKSDGRFRCDADVPVRGKFTWASDGPHTWIESERLGFGLVPMSQMPTVLHLDAVWESWKIGVFYPERSLLPDGAVGGRPCRRVEMIGRDRGRQIWSFDAASGQLVRMEIPAGVAKDGIVVVFSDFRTTDGVTLPWMIQATGPFGAESVRRENVAINPPVDPSEFSPTPRELEQAGEIQSVLSRSAAALGGAQAIRRVKTRVTRMSVEVSPTGVNSQVVMTQKMPDRVLIESDTPGMGRALTGYDGATGWAFSDIQGYRTLKPAEVAQLLNEADLDSVAAMLGQCPLRRDLGRQAVDGHWARAIALATAYGPVGTFYFDEDRFLLLRQEGAVVRDSASLLAATIDLGDYRPVDGLLVPFSIIITSAATQVRCRIDSIRDNVPLNDAIFKPRKDED